MNEENNRPDPHFQHKSSAELIKHQGLEFLGPKGIVLSIVVGLLVMANGNSKTRDQENPRFLYDYVTSITVGNSGNYIIRTNQGSINLKPSDVILPALPGACEQEAQAHQSLEGALERLVRKAQVVIRNDSVKEVGYLKSGDWTSLNPDLVSMKLAYPVNGPSKTPWCPG